MSEQKHTPIAWNKAGGYLLDTDTDTMLSVDPRTGYEPWKHDALMERIARRYDAFGDLLAACRAVLRAPSVGSGGPGSVTIEVQSFVIDELRAAIQKAERRE